MAKQVTIAKREKTLEAEGFLPTEAKFYARWPISSPGMMQVRRHRRGAMKRAALHIPAAQIPNYIRQSFEARGYIRGGKLDVDRWNMEVFEQLQLPRAKRTQMFIPPTRYTPYMSARWSGLTAAHSNVLARSIPPDQWQKRMADFNTLRSHHFTIDEATRIVTARTPKGYLQKLNLQNDHWRQLIRERENWYAMQYKLGKAKGLTPRQIDSEIKGMIDDYYKRSKDRTPWDWLKDAYKVRDKPHIDFAEGQAARREKMAKRRMPYRARQYRIR